MSEDVEIEILHLTTEMMKRMEPCILPGKHARPVLWHTDLHMGTKMVFLGRDNRVQALIAIVLDNLKLLEHNRMIIELGVYHEGL
jgi:hypothetical protein